MRKQCRIIPLLAGLLWLLLAGCDRADRVSLGAETDNPQYRRGQQLLKQGRNQEALGAFLRVIDERGGDAPESHLGAGLIYQQYSPKEPIYAIYHFRRYLELEPHSRQADLVRQRIEAATRDFARSLPGQPLESQTARLELMEKIDELQKENQQLKDQISELRPAGASSGTATRIVDSPASSDVRPSPLVVRAPAVGNPTGRPPAVTVVPTRPERQPSINSPNPAPVSGGRRHVVAQGDTLYKIAQRYYGSGAKWPEILAANRDQLKNENSVRPGMELRIP